MKHVYTQVYIVFAKYENLNQQNVRKKLFKIFQTYSVAFICGTDH